MVAYSVNVLEGTFAPQVVPFPHGSLVFGQPDGGEKMYISHNAIKELNLIKNDEKTLTFKIQFKDGAWFTGTCDKATYDKLERHSQQSSLEKDFTIVNFSPEEARARLNKARWEAINASMSLLVILVVVIGLPLAVVRSCTTHMAEKEAIRNSPAEQQRKAERALESKARWECESIIRSATKFPDKADFNLLDWSEKTYGFSITIQGSGEFMNGMGAMIPHKFVCKFTQTGPTEIKLVDYDMWPG